MKFIEGTGELIHPPILAPGFNPSFISRIAGYLRGLSGSRSVSGQCHTCETKTEVGSYECPDCWRERQY